MAHLTHSDLFHRIKDLKHQHGLTTFVETGTGNGVSLEAAIRMGFKRLFSCDIDPIVVQKANTDFKHVVTLCCPSDLFLANLVTLGGRYLVGDERTLFWLDAHFPEVPSTDPGFPALDWPLMNELKIIKRAKQGYENDVILCDDMLDKRVHFDPSEYVLMFADTHDAHFWCDGSVLALVPHES